MNIGDLVNILDARVHCGESMHNIAMLPANLSSMGESDSPVGISEAEKALGLNERRNLGDGSGNS